MSPRPTVYLSSSARSLKALCTCLASLLLLTSPPKKSEGHAAPNVRLTSRSFPSPQDTQPQQPAHRPRITHIHTHDRHVYAFLVSSRRHRGRMGRRQTSLSKSGENPRKKELAVGQLLSPTSMLCSLQGPLLPHFWLQKQASQLHRPAADTGSSSPALAINPVFPLQTFPRESSLTFLCNQLFSSYCSSSSCVSHAHILRPFQSAPLVLSAHVRRAARPLPASHGQRLS